MKTLIKQLLDKYKERCADLVGNNPIDEDGIVDFTYSGNSYGGGADEDLVTFAKEVEYYALQSVINDLECILSKEENK